MVIRKRQRIVEATEQALARTLIITANDEGCSRIVGYLPDAVILVIVNNFHQITAQPLPRLLQGQATAADGLQMGMIRRRGTTMWPIIQ